MSKLLTRLGIVALIFSAALYGCGKHGGSPTAPSTKGASLLRTSGVEVPACGEVSYLADLSGVLPQWRDSLQSWIPDLELNAPPEWTGGPVADFLGQLVPVLQQWRTEVNTARGSDLLAAVADFDPATTTTQAYLTTLSGVLAGWKTAADDAAGHELLTTPPTFAPDEFAPVIVCPSDTTFACADSAGVVLNYTATAVDDCDPAPVVVCDPPSGSTFHEGTTTVMCVATDASGNHSSCSFNVTVGFDTTPPVLTCPNDTTVTCASPDGIAVDFNVGATDACDEAPVVHTEPVSGSVFPVGTTTVTSTATDASGNSSSCSFTVTVEAAEVNVLHAVASPAQLWPPNHQMVDIHFALDVQNECGLALTTKVIDVTSNEPEDGLGDGHFAPDWVIGKDGSLKLRAERSGTGSGRVYTIHLRTEDASGVGDDATVQVIVPHDRGAGLAATR